MANQATPITSAVQNRHVEKIILSGSSFVSSILGLGAHIITAASVPLFFRNPIISGSVVAPSILTCDGDSFDSSPRASIAYQWKKDAVNITDETNKTYTTVMDDIDAEITCLVTVTNASGSDNVLSNGLTIEAVDTSWTYQLDIHAIQGFSAPPRADMVDADIQIISGIPHLLQGTVMEQSLITVTGMAVDEQVVMASVEVYAIVL